MAQDKNKPQRPVSVPNQKHTPKPGTGMDGGNNRRTINDSVTVSSTVPSPKPKTSGK